MDPVPPPSPRSGPNWALIFGLGCGGCLLVIVFLVAGGFFLFRAGSDAFKEVDPVARTFVAHVFAGEADSAYALISTQWKQTTSRQKFDGWVEFCRKQLGGQPTLTFGGYNFYSGTGGRRETVTYQLMHGKESGQMSVTLVRESGQIRVAAANFSGADSGGSP